jgi:hypothetical protein
MFDQKCFRGVVVGLSLMLTAESVWAQSAQSEVGLADLVNHTYLVSLGGFIESTGAHDVLDVQDLRGLEAGAAMSSALAVALGSFPIGSSSGGFTYFFDASSGAYVRSSQSFGPAFAERPLTGGRGKFSFGMTHQHRRYDRLEGKSLREGEVVMSDVLRVADIPLDVIQSTFTVTIDTDTTTLFGTYGVTDKLDVSLAVPLQRVNVDASVMTGLLTYSDPPVTASTRQQASGIGDIALRAKYNFLKRSSSSFAAGMDLRLPTGDDENLLGTGNTRVQIYGAAATQLSRVSPHVNIGYTFGSDPGDTRFYYGSEVNYAVGAEVVLTPRATMVGDIIGRSLADEGRLHEVSKTAEFLLLEQTTYSGLEYQYGERLNTLLGTVGVKFSPGSTFMISTHVLFPLRSAGLQSGVTPVFGVDYTF